MTVEFEYNNEKYFYESGWILKPDQRYSDPKKFAEKVCPIARFLHEETSLADVIGEAPMDEARAILRGILFGYRFGYDSGWADKASDIRRALNIPEVL